MIVFLSNHFHFWICFNVHSIVLILIILVPSWHCIVVPKRCLSAYARGLRSFVPHNGFIYCPWLLVVSLNPVRWCASFRILFRNPVDTSCHVLLIVEASVLAWNYKFFLVYTIVRGGNSSPEKQHSWVSPRFTHFVLLFWGFSFQKKKLLLGVKDKYWRLLSKIQQK